MPADFVNAYVLGNLGHTESVAGACASFLYNLRAAVHDIRSGARQEIEIPADIAAGWDNKAAGQTAENAWNETFAAYKAANADKAAEFERRVMNGDLPADWEEKSAAYVAEVNAAAETKASRQASLASIEAYSPMLPELFGGSTDLGCSNLTEWSGFKPMRADTPDCNYINYGVREFGMSAIMNGVTLHGGFIPYGATFLVFMEYARNAVRMAALMKQRSIFVYTHDSIGLGEDGPTHQPIEQLANLRTTPNMSVWRPCDAVESAVAWKMAIEKKDGPSALIFSRQGLPHVNRSSEQVANVAKGGYVVVAADKPTAIIIATGSEVGIALEAAAELEKAGQSVQVVSMPCTDYFDKQDASYRESVLPSGVKRVAVEASIKDYWYKYVGLDGAIIGMSTFGESAPIAALYEHFGITAAKIVEAVKSL